MIYNPMRHDFDISFVSAGYEVATQRRSFREVIGEIAGDKWADRIKAVREAYAAGGKDAANKLKRALPGALFCGTFSQRNAKSLTERSGLICVDLDNLGASLDSYKDIITAEEHTLACFVSPTGTGLKVIFHFDAEVGHSEVFASAKHHVMEKFGLEIDSACSDVSRLCFVSHDPDAFVAEDAKPLTIRSEPREFVAPFTPAPPLSAPILSPARVAGPAPLMGTDLAPGDDYDLRGDLAGLLRSHGWTEAGQRKWRRPGKTNGISATWDIVPRRFYVFSDATDFAPNHVYRPWHAFAILECGGDFKRAAGELAKHGFGTQRQERLTPRIATTEVIDLDDGAAPPARPALVARPLTDFHLPQKGDGSVLLGNRYLSRGDGAILASTSGMGKSSLSLQAAVTWSLGMDLFGGFTPSGPLRSLIFQSEDSDGDVAEVKFSLIHAMKLTPEQQAQVGERVKIVTDRIHRGLSFLTELKRQIALHQPDIVWINPLLAFIGGDVNDAEAAGEFLREGLNSINEPASFAYIIVHHTSKPPKEKSDRKWNEVMYDMAGSADLTNWARAIISLRADDAEGQFQLVLAKRGRRAGCRVEKVSDSDIKFYEPTNVINIRHSTARFCPDGGDEMAVIHWEQFTKTASSTEGKQGRPRSANFSDFMPVWPVGLANSKGFRAIHRLVKEMNPLVGNTAFGNMLQDAVEIGRLKLDNRVPSQPKYYRELI